MSVFQLLSTSCLCHLGQKRWGCQCKWEEVAQVPGKNSRNGTSASASFKIQRQAVGSGPLVLSQKAECWSGDTRPASGTLPGLQAVKEHSSSPPVVPCRHQHQESASSRWQGKRYSILFHRQEQNLGKHCPTALPESSGLDKATALSHLGLAALWNRSELRQETEGRVKVVSPPAHPSTRWYFFGCSSALTLLIFSFTVFSSCVSSSQDSHP